MKKNFKIANRPLTTTAPEASALENAAPAIDLPPIVKETNKNKTESDPLREIFTGTVATAGVVPAAVVAAVAAPREQPTTRKTIEVPEEYFHKVKMRAVERRIREKDLWAEILAEYFINNP